jgi:hypothetical protein
VVFLWCHVVFRSRRDIKNFYVKCTGQCFSTIVGTDTIVSATFKQMHAERVYLGIG